MGALGLDTPGGIFVELVPSGTAVPYRGSELVTTNADDQHTIAVHFVTRGVDLDDHNPSVANLTITNVSAAPRTQPQFELSIDIDAGGTLQVGVHNVDSPTPPQVERLDPIPGVRVGRSRLAVRDGRLRSELGLDVGGTFLPLFPATTRIPALLQERVTTQVDGQTSIGVRLLERGPGLPDPHRLFGTVSGSVSASPAGQSHLAVTLFVDERGAVFVATEPTSPESPADEP